MQVKLDKTILDDPFKQVLNDLDYTRTFAIKNILQTDYTELQKAALYNLELKGKNFRSAILFNLAKAIYYGENPQNASEAFENTKYYQ